MSTTEIDELVRERTLIDDCIAVGRLLRSEWEARLQELQTRQDDVDRQLRNLVPAWTPPRQDSEEKKERRNRLLKLAELHRVSTNERT